MGVSVNSLYCKEAEEFISFPFGDGFVALQSHDGRWLTVKVDHIVSEIGVKTVQCQTECTKDAMFSVTESDGKFGFKSVHSEFMSAPESMALEWESEKFEDGQLWTV